MMQIDIVELKQVIDRLFDHIIETKGVRQCEFDKDNYWNVPSQELFEANDPKELDIGSLSDDWEFLSKLLKPENKPVACQLTQVAPILRYLGEYLGEKLAKDGG